MRPSRFLVLLPLVVAGLALTGCSGSSAGEGSGNGAGGPTLTGPRSSAATSVPTATQGVPTPDSVQTSTLITALTAVDPGLGLDATQAVSNATSLCSALRDGRDPADAVPSTFPDVDLDAAQQTAVAAAVTSTFCPLAATTASATSSASG